MARSSSDSRRAYQGPAVLQYGFRPFFLAAGLWSVLAMGLWLAMLTGRLALPSVFDSIIWHSHEMLFGFAGAAIAGFLLTAVPNWTGRLPVHGWPLGVLCTIWLAGRIAVTVSELIGALPSALIDLAFLVSLCVVLMREILAGRNWRNLPVVAVVAVLAVCNLLIHLEFLGYADTAALGLRLTVATIVLLISLIGGRIVPSFTRNWLAKRDETELPQPFGWLDKATLLATLAAGLAWAFASGSLATAWLCLLAAVAHACRLARWRGARTLGEPLVWVLHLGYGWVATGFALLGLSVLIPGVAASTALHALTAGAMGTMILAIMTRATLGHTGRALAAGRGTTAVYLLVTLATLLRIATPLLEAATTLLWVLAALCWIGAFGLFVVLYIPLLTKPRSDQAS